ncbi:hypothetical protein Droror1_Dr00016459 [Drosera rotundifolia]
MEYNEAQASLTTSVNGKSFLLTAKKLSEIFDVPNAGYDTYAKFTLPMVDEIESLASVKLLISELYSMLYDANAQLKEEEKKEVELSKELNIVKLQLKKIQDIFLPNLTR